jgi:hypothetical protein
MHDKSEGKYLHDKSEGKSKCISNRKKKVIKDEEEDEDSRSKMSSSVLIGDLDLSQSNLRVSSNSRRGNRGRP